MALVTQVKGTVGRAYRAAQYEAGRRIFEPGFGETRATVDASTLGLERGNMHYEASHYTFLTRALFGMQVSSQDVFVDYGCGKGRIVYQAARRPFGKVIGVELSSELRAIAEANLEEVRPRLRCPDVEIVNADAMTWPLPDDTTFVYLFNSVQGDVLQGMLDQVVASLDRAPRRLHFFYVNPVHSHRVQATERFTLMRVSRGIRRGLVGQTVEVYRST